MRDFHPLEVADRGSDTQLRMGENLNYFNLAICELMLALRLRRLPNIKPRLAQSLLSVAV